MRNSNKLVEDLQKGIFDDRHGIFIEHFTIFLHHLVNQESVLKLIMNRIIPLIFDNGLDTSQFSISKVQQKHFVFFNSSIDELSDDVAQKSSIGFTKLFDVEFISIERLDLFVIFLCYNFAEFMKKYVFGLVYAVILGFYEL